jgi:hypothetical protein
MMVCLLSSLLLLLLLLLVGEHGAAFVRPQVKLPQQRSLVRRPAQQQAACGCPYCSTHQLSAARKSCLLALAICCLHISSNAQCGQSCQLNSTVPCCVCIHSLSS